MLHVTKKKKNDTKSTSEFNLFSVDDKGHLKTTHINKTHSFAACFKSIVYTVVFVQIHIRLS